MEQLNFLSGKYKDGERIVPGAVQTFQANETASGRAVFVHRVPTTGAEAQSAVIRLLKTALLRSAAVRKLVLEVADEDGFCYVITDNAEQCLLLREWLQFELDQAGARPDAAKPAAQPNAAPPAPIAAPLPAAAPVATPPPTPAPMNTNPPAAKPNPPTGDSAPGEFTRMFQVPPPSAGSSPTPAPVVPPASARVPGRAETGEFTRFFRNDMPGKKPDSGRRPDKPSSSESMRAQRSGVVQRPPNAPVPPLPQRSSDSGELKIPFADPRRNSDSGEFRRLFSTPENTGSLPAAPTANPGFGSMPRTVGDEPGEYTRIFGSGNSAPPLPQPAAPPPELPGRFDFLDAGSTPSSLGNLPQGPSEYTRIIGPREMRQPLAPEMQTMGTSQPPGSDQAAPGAAPAMPQISQVKLPPAAVPPAPAVPVAQAHPPVAPPPMPAPHLQLPKQAPLPAVPKSGNKRLAIFLVILGLLAVALVILVILFAKK